MSNVSVFYPPEAFFKILPSRASGSNDRVKGRGRTIDFMEKVERERHHNFRHFQLQIISGTLYKNNMKPINAIGCF